MAIDPNDIFTTELVVDGSQANAALQEHQAQLGKTEAAIKKVTAAQDAQRASSEGQSAAERVKNNNLTTAIDRLEKYAARMDPVSRLSNSYTRNLADLTAVQKAGLSVTQQAIDAVTRQGAALARARQEVDGTAQRYRVLGAGLAEAVTTQERMTASAQRIKDSLNPLAAAQRQYAAAVAEVNNLNKVGLLTDAERAAQIQVLGTAFAAQSKAIAANAKTAGGAFGLAGYQVTNFFQQLQDVGVQLAGGQNPFLIIVQQAPQAAFALGGVAESWRIIKEATAAAVASLATVRGALIATGIGAAAVALGLLIEAIASAAAESSRFKKALEDQDKALDTTAGNAKELSAAYIDMTENMRHAFDLRLIEQADAAMKGLTETASGIGKEIAKALAQSDGNPFAFLGGGSGALEYEAIYKVRDALAELAKAGDYAGFQKIVDANHTLLSQYPELNSTVIKALGVFDEWKKKADTVAATQRLVAGSATDADRALLGLIPTAGELATATEKANLEFQKWLVEQAGGKTAVAEYVASLDGVRSAMDQQAIANAGVKDAVSAYDKALQTHKAGVIEVAQAELYAAGTAAAQQAAAAASKKRFDELINSAHGASEAFITYAAAQAAAGGQAFDDFMANIDKVVGRLRNLAGDGAPKSTGIQDGIKEKIAEIQKQIEAQDKLNAAYAGGDAAVEVAKRDIDALTKVQGLNRNATAAQVAEYERLVREQIGGKLLDAVNDNIAASDRQVAANDRLIVGYRQGGAAIAAAATANEAYAQAVQLGVIADAAHVKALQDKAAELARSNALLDLAKAAQSTRDQIELVQLETGALGMNETERRKLIDARKIELDYAARGIAANDNEVQSLIRQNNALIDGQAVLEQHKASLAAIQQIGTQAFEDVGKAITDALVNDQPVKWKNVWKAAIASVVAQFATLAAINPFENWIFGSQLPTLGGATAALGGTGAAAGASSTGSLVDLLGLTRFFGSGGSTGGLGLFSSTEGLLSGANAYLFGTAGTSAATTGAAAGFLTGGGAASSGAVASPGLFGTAGATSLGAILGSAGAGFGISQLLAGLAPGNKLVSAGGGALGGAGIGFMVGGPIGAAIGGVAGLLGGLLNDKPSDMTGTSLIANLSSTAAGVDGGQFGKKYSAENHQAAATLTDTIRDAAQTAFGRYADLSALGVAAGVGSRDGSKTYINQNGVTIWETSASSDEAGLKSLMGRTIAEIGTLVADKLPIEMQKALEKIDFSGDIDEALRLLDFASAYKDTVKSLTEGIGLEDTARTQAKAAIDATIDSLKKFKVDAATLGLDGASAAVREFALTLVGLKEKQQSVSDTEAALAALDETFKELRASSADLGLTLSEIDQGYAASLDKLRTNFNSALDRSINEGLSLGVLNAAADLLATQKQRLADAAAVGADMGRVFRLNALEMAALYKDLDDTQIAALNQMIALADDLGATVASALAQVTTSADALIEQARDARAAAIQMGQTWVSIAKDLRSSIDALRVGKASTLSPADLLHETETQFRAVFGQALAGDTDAAKNLAASASTYLDAAKGYYASSQAYQNVFAGVQSMLEQVAVGADTRATGYAALAASLDTQTGILEQIRDVIARSQDIASLSDTLEGMITEGAITSAAQHGISAAIAGLTPLVSNNTAALSTLTSVAQAVQDGTLTAAEVSGLRAAITAIGNVDISQQIATFQNALADTGATIAGLNTFLDDAAGAIPVAIVTAFQDGLDEAALSQRLGAVLSTTLDATKAAIQAGLQGDALSNAIITPIAGLMRSWAASYTGQLSSVFNAADFAIGFNEATGNVIAAYQTSADAVSSGITSAVASITWDALAQQVTAAQQLVGTRFAAAVGGLTFDGIDGTLLTQAIYGPKGVITQVSASLQGSASSLAGELTATIGKADFSLVGARIDAAVAIAAGGAQQVTIAASGLSTAALDLMAAGAAQIELVADALVSGATKIRALDTSVINMTIAAWNGQDVEIRALDTSRINAAVGAWNGRNITISTLDSSAVDATVGVWNAQKITLRAIDASTVNVAVQTWNAQAVALSALNTARVNASVDSWNAQRVALTAVDASAINVAVASWNGQKVVLTAADASSINAAVAAWNTQKVTLQPLDTAAITAAVQQVGTKAAADVASDYATTLRSVFGATIGAKLDAAVTPIFSVAGVVPFSSRLNTAFGEVFGKADSAGVSASVSALVASNNGLVASLASLKAGMLALSDQYAQAAAAAAKDAADKAAAQAAADALAQKQDAAILKYVTQAGGYTVSATSAGTASYKIGASSLTYSAPNQATADQVSANLKSALRILDLYQSLTSNAASNATISVTGNRVAVNDNSRIFDSEKSLWRDVFDMLQAAYGAAPGADRITQFASGAAFLEDGVYLRPTMFDRATMAEDGPEAVMPLTNVGGKLGVRAVGGGDGGDGRAIVAELREQNRVLRQLLAAVVAGDEKTREEIAKRLDDANDVARQGLSAARRKGAA